MISPDLVRIVRCPDCGGALSGPAEAPACGACGRSIAAAAGYLDLRPAAAFDENTRYLDEALHADARHETVSPPLLQAGVRQHMLRRFLQPGPGEMTADFGCGSGRSLVWNRASGAALVGIDVAPYFAAEALERSDLVLADLRRLPFEDGTFAKGYTLDVFEHLSHDALAAVLAEMARVMQPGGRVFAYSHVRRNSSLAVGLRAVNALARTLERIGLIDLRQERLRKSDHVNPLADVADLERTLEAAGFRIVRIRYYTPLIGAVVENILMRVAERALGRWRGRQARRAGAAFPGSQAADARSLPAEELRLARTAAKARLAARGPLYVALRALTAVMMIDVWLFGRIRTGPFFVLFEKTASR